MLRIISGMYRSRLLKTPSLEITRPTTDRVREAIFGSIHFQVSGATCLDLFAGSGAMGIEAISRGATQVVGAEKNVKAYQIVVENLKQLKIDNYQIFNIDAINLIETKKDIKFDFIFMDPPYNEHELVLKSLNLILKNQILKNDGTIILETNNKSFDVPQGFIIKKHVDYGKTSIYYIAQL